MRNRTYDALVIGGGPGGSAAATYLARQGKRVLLLEKEIFPRFHIGESLLPYNRPLFEEMGLTSALQEAGFPVKSGAQFHLSSGARNAQFIFRNGPFTRFWDAFQVERSKFDHILLKNARACGTDAREGWTVTRFASDGDGVTVQARSPERTSEEFRASFLVDASGRSNLTGNQEGLRVVHPKLKKLAVFGHFTGVRLDEGERAWDTIIVRLQNKWFWVIPLSSERTSVGCVMDAEEYAKAQATPAEVFHCWVDSSAVLRQRMKDARLLNSIQTTSDFSYRNRRFISQRLLRVGDAAGFMDPIFSAGVYLAMQSGKMAAEAITQSLQEHGDGAGSLAAYERKLNSAMAIYWQMIENYYAPSFFDLFLQPKERFNLPAAVNAVLAGELNGGWRVHWRMKLFFFFIKLQSHWPLVPRISFDGLSSSEESAMANVR